MTIISLSKIKKFVVNCYYEGGGFKFSEEDSLPSAHATRCALQIDDWFSKHNKGVLNNGTLIDKKKKEETKSFLNDKLYNKYTGGYSGYPLLLNIENIMKCPLLRQTYNNLARIGT